MAATFIPQAAGITGILTAAGLPEREIKRWFRTPRAELALLTPGVMLAFSHAFPGAGDLCLRLAEQDAVEISRDLPRGWEGSD